MEKCERVKHEGVITMRLLLLVGWIRLASPTTLTYTNPVLAEDFPDPAVVRTANGTFVAYATGGGSPRSNIQCATSPDLVSWTMQPDALPEMPKWACSSCSRSVAPDVQLHGGVYFMYFSAYRASDNKTNCIGVAPSSNATGPFDGEPDPIVCDDRRGCAMDPRSYDAADGSLYLYYGSHHDPIMALRLDASRLRAAANAAVAVPTVRPDASSYGELVEAPWTYTDATGALTMLYSGSQCCGADAHYAVMAARSLESASDPAGGQQQQQQQPLGPWTKLGGPDGSQSVILEASTARQVTAPGHCAVVRDDEGVDWLVYHAMACPSNASASCPRELFIDRLYYNRSWGGSDTWPWTAGPTSNEREAPRFF